MKKVLFERITQESVEKQGEIIHLVGKAHCSRTFWKQSGFIHLTEKDFMDTNSY